MLALSLTTLLLLCTVTPGSPKGALKGAISCFRELDYACAEEKLAEALRAEELPVASRLLARRYEALLALAFHDKARARRAVRSLLALDPDYDPGEQAPPRFAALVADARAETPAQRLFDPSFRAGGNVVLLFGHDAQSWGDGPQVELAAGLGLGGRTVIELGLSYGQHEGRSFSLRRLGLGMVTLGLDRRFLGPSPRLSLGVGLGPAHVSAEGITGRTGYWGVVARVPVELAIHIWSGIWLAARVAPALLAVEDRDRMAFSVLLPLGMAVCYLP